MHPTRGGIRAAEGGVQAIARAVNNYWRRRASSDASQAASRQVKGTWPFVLYPFSGGGPRPKVGTGYGEAGVDALTSELALSTMSECRISTRRVDVPQEETRYNRRPLPQELEPPQLDKLSELVEWVQSNRTAQQDRIHNYENVKFALEEMFKEVVLAALDNQSELPQISIISCHTGAIANLRGAAFGHLVKEIREGNNPYLEIKEEHQEEAFSRIEQLIEERNVTALDEYIDQLLRAGSLDQNKFLTYCKNSLTIIYGDAHPDLHAGTSKSGNAHGTSLAEVLLPKLSNLFPDLCKTLADREDAFNPARVLLFGTSSIDSAEQVIIDQLVEKGFTHLPASQCQEEEGLGKKLKDFLTRMEEEMKRGLPDCEPAKCKPVVFVETDVDVTRKRHCPSVATPDGQLPLKVVTDAYQEALADTKTFILSVAEIAYNNSLTKVVYDEERKADRKRPHDPTIATALHILAAGLPSDIAADLPPKN